MCFAQSKPIFKEGLTKTVCKHLSWRLSTTTKLTCDAFDDVDGSNFCHDIRSFGLVNGFKMGAVFLRNDIGIPSESFFAQMERVLASLRVQSYNAKKGNPIFLQICGVSKC